MSSSFRVFVFIPLSCKIILNPFVVPSGFNHQATSSFTCPCMNHTEDSGLLALCSRLRYSKYKWDRTLLNNRVSRGVLHSVTVWYRCLDDQIPYSGKLSREKTFTNPRNISFCGENLRGFTTDRILWAINQSGPHPFSWRKLARMVSDPRNSWKFSPSKVSRYMVDRSLVVVLHMRMTDLLLQP